MSEEIIKMKTPDIGQAMGSYLCKNGKPLRRVEAFLFFINEKRIFVFVLLIERKIFFGGKFMKKILSILLIALLLPIGVFATDYDTSQINGVENTTVDTTNGGSSTNISVVDPTTPIDPDMTVNNIIDPNITVTDFGNKILSKLYEVASLLQKIAAPVAIVMFIVGAILMVIGALGKRDGMKQGIVVMVLSIITYAVCMYAQPIVIAVSNWLVA